MLPLLCPWRCGKARHCRGGPSSGPDTGSGLVPLVAASVDTRQPTNGPGPWLAPHRAQKGALMATRIHADAEVPPPAVIVAGGVVQITVLVDSDPEVVRIVSEADDPEGTVHALLRIGAQAARIASTDLDTELVERRFASMVNGFDVTVSKAVAGITGATEQLLDEDSGSLPKVIAGMRQELEVLLGETFNADSKTSVIAKVELAVTDVVQQIVAHVRSTLSLDQPDSPLARTKRELTDVVRQEVGAVAKEMRDVGLALATKAAAAAVADKLTAK